MIPVVFVYLFVYLLFIYLFISLAYTNTPSFQGIIEKYGLALQSSGFFAGYDININAGIANSVATQALQFVASMMPNNVAYFDSVSVYVLLTVV